MKITRNNLRKLILQEVSSFQMKQYDNESNNILMMTSVIMTGMQTQTGQTLDEDDEYEYGQEIRHILENNMPVTKALSDVFMEIRSGGGFKDPEPTKTVMPSQDSGPFYSYDPGVDEDDPEGPLMDIER
tara:strand:+ start:2704 stop:3090 length:387 start_codon:yes stop_codon:yes gene_type:complete